MRVVGTIRSIDLVTKDAHFEHLPPRNVARIELDIERATDDDGEDLDVVALSELAFQGPAELAPRYAVGERVQIVTSADGALNIMSIKAAPLS